MATLASIDGHMQATALSASGAAGPPARRRRSALWSRSLLSAQRFLWALLSIGAFTVIWELCWLAGLADPKLLPPPHIFLGDMTEQAKYFNTATRWSIGVNPADGPSPYQAVLITIGATTMRVLHIRSSVHPDQLGPIVRREIQGLGPDVPIAEIQTMRQALGSAGGYMLLRLERRIGPWIGRRSGPRCGMERRDRRSRGPRRLDPRMPRRGRGRDLRLDRSPAHRVALGGAVPRDLPLGRGGLTWASTRCSRAGSSGATCCSS